MIELTLSRETVALLGANMESHCTLSTLQSGLNLYLDNKVTHIWKDQFNIIHAIVINDAGTDYKLQLDLDFFLASECSCNSDNRFCAHMVAVFFMLYRDHAKPEQWLQAVAASSLSPSKQSDDPSSNTHNANTALDLNADAANAYQAPSNWDRLLSRELDLLFRRQTDRHRIDIFYYTALKKLSAFAEIVHEAEKPYFRLFCAIQLMLHAEAYLTKHADDYQQAYLHRVTLDLSDHFMDKIRDTVQQASPTLQQTKLIHCAITIRDLLSQAMPLTESTVFRWGDVHRYLWTNLFLDPTWREAESLRLTEAEHAENGSERPSIAMLMAGHLDWLLGRDEAAMQKLATMSHSHTGLIVTYLDTLVKTASWTRLRKWLDFILPYLRRASSETMNKALLMWRDYANRTGESSSFQHALTSLLPRSYTAYTEFLIHGAHYEQWVDFHLLNGIPPSKIDWTQLKEVEQKKPSLAIPIYHHAVERLLVTRNRTAYREIVKMLKRLKEAYVAAG